MEESSEMHMCFNILHKVAQELFWFLWLQKKWLQNRCSHTLCQLYTCLFAKWQESDESQIF